MPFRLSEARKVGGRGKIAFNLPPEVSCIGRTRECARFCYGKGGRFTTSAVRGVFEENWRALLAYETRGLAGAAAHEIASLLHRPVFRIHSVGDFHSPFAVDVWTRTARARPDVLFWCYTRSFALDMRRFSALPNVRVWASADRCNLHAARAFAKAIPRGGIAFGPWDPRARLPAGLVFCRALHPDPGARIDHDGACLECRLCMPGAGGRGRDYSGSIVFPLHTSARSPGGVERFVDDGLPFADHRENIVALGGSAA